jgi:hypothetical protein
MRTQLTIGLMLASLVGLDAAAVYTLLARLNAALVLVLR